MTPCSESYHLFQTRQNLKPCNLNLFSMVYKTRDIINVVEKFSKIFEDKTKILVHLKLLYQVLQHIFSMTLGVIQSSVSILNTKLVTKTLNVDV